MDIFSVIIISSFIAILSAVIYLFLYFNKLIQHQNSMMMSIGEQLNTKIEILRESLQNELLKQQEVPEQVPEQVIINNDEILEPEIINREEENSDTITVSDRCKDADKVFDIPTICNDTIQQPGTPVVLPNHDKCIYILKIGRNKGKPCGKDVRKGTDYCSQHLAQLKKESK